MNNQTKSEMKTKEGIFNEQLVFNKWLKELTESEKDHILSMMESYASQRIEKYRELIEWLNDECPAVSPPLEPYTTADLSHDFAEKLRTKLDDLK